MMSPISSGMFAPISMNEYVREHLAANPGTDRADLIERLRSALAGAKCACGGRVWVLGSAEVGLSCFTCITGEGIVELAHGMEYRLYSLVNTERLCANYGHLLLLPSGVNLLKRSNNRPWITLLSNISMILT